MAIKVGSELKESAEILGKLLFLGACKDSESIFEEIRKFQKRSIEEIKLGEIFDEMLYFYLHLMDRFAFEYLEMRRDRFLDNILLEVFKDHFESYKSTGGRVDAETFYRIFKKTYKEKQEEYGKYQLVPEEGKGFKGNLFWEFEKKIAQIFGQRDNAALIVFVHTILTPLVDKYHELCEKVMGEVV